MRGLLLSRVIIALLSSLMQNEKSPNQISSGSFVNAVRLGALEF